MKKTISVLKAHPVITAIIAVALAFFGTKLLKTNAPTIELALLRIVLSMMMCAFLYLISGTKTFDKCADTTGYVIKHLWVMWLIPILLGVPALISCFATGTQMYADWPLQLLYTMILCLFVGIFEEITFRAVINDALLIKFRNTKGIFVIIAIVSSFVFGVVHVIGADFSNPSVAVLAVLKTISTGLFGLSLLFLYWKTRNIWGCAIIHGTYDFLSLITNALFVSSTEQAAETANRYTSTNMGVGGWVIYIIQIVFALVVILVLVFKVVKKTDFGQMRKEW